MIMSYFGCIGNIMADTGLDVYAKDSVVHMMNGHAYSRSLAAHLTTSAALLCMLLKIEENSSYLSSIEQIVIDLQKKDIAEGLSQNEKVAHIRRVVENMEAIVKSSSLTVELWIQYLELLVIIKLFISSIRLGDMDTYQYCLMKMIPVYHDAGHLAYAKCTRFYLHS